MIHMSDDFATFEHEGWQRVANKYDSTWSRSTRQFIPPLLDLAEVAAGMKILDVGCGPGYVAAAAAERAAEVTGLDFSSEMVSIAKTLFPRLSFQVGDAQQLPFADASFDRVLTSFALLHVSDPERACAEACRVLRSSGKLGFTVWAPPDVNPYARVVDEALDAHADLNVSLPAGPSHHVYSDEGAFRIAMERAGFRPESMALKLHTIEWIVPSVDFVFEAERFAGVRTAGLLAKQTPPALEKIRQAIAVGLKPYARGDGYAIPKAAYVVAVTKP